MDFSSPSVMYEVGLHGPDFDVAGSTVAGYPCIMFGHNNHGAFTSTAGIDNLVQTFEVDVEINEDGPDTYEFQGETEEIEEVEKTIEVADGENVTYTERFTRHGVVTQWNPEAGQAIVQTRSYAGRHMTCFRGYYDIQFAENVEEFSEAGRQCDYAVNLLWADRNGDIGYFHLGRYPDFESVEWDTRFPADGNQYELTEEDYRRAADGTVPYSINPPAGYSASWNNKHAPGWHAGDLNYNYSTDHRVQRIINRVERRLHTDGELNYEFLKSVPEDLAFIDLRSIRYKEHLLDALDGADLTETEQTAKAQLESWGHIAEGDGPDSMGTYPPGYTIWDETFGNVLGEIYGPVFGDGLGLGLVFHNNNYGRGALMRLLNPEETALDLSEHADYGDPEDALVRAFRSAVETLDSEFEGGPSEWRRSAAVDSLSTMSLFGIPVGSSSAGEMAQMNRGTEEHFVRLSDDIHAENILPPGNDGYIAPDGSTGPHFDDQLDMFRNFEYKQLLLADEDVEAATESTRELTFEAQSDDGGDGSDDDGGADDGGTSDGGVDDGGAGDGSAGDGGADDGGADDGGTDDGSADDGSDDDEDSADDSGPGFGVGGSIAALGSAGYLLKRKLTADETE
jgi:penicillin amidase